MTSFSTIRHDIETEFTNNWDADTYPIAYDNTAVDLPETSWVRLSIVPTVSFNAVVGTDEVRNSGNVSVQVFVPLDQGTGEAYDMVDLAILAIANKTINGHLFTYAGRVVHIGEGIRKLKDIESGLYQLQVLVPYDSQ